MFSNDNNYAYTLNLIASIDALFSNEIKAIDLYIKPKSDEHKYCLGQLI